MKTKIAYVFLIYTSVLGLCFIPTIVKSGVTLDNLSLVIPSILSSWTTFIVCRFWIKKKPDVEAMAITMWSPAFVFLAFNRVIENMPLTEASLQAFDFLIVLTLMLCVILWLNPENKAALQKAIQMFGTQRLESTPMKRLPSSKKDEVASTDSPQEEAAFLEHFVEGSLWPPKPVVVYRTLENGHIQKGVGFLGKLTFFEREQIRLTHDGFRNETFLGFYISKDTIKPQAGVLFHDWFAWFTPWQTQLFGLDGIDLTVVYKEAVEGDTL